MRDDHAHMATNWGDVSAAAIVGVDRWIGALARPTRAADLLVGSA